MMDRVRRAAAAVRRSWVRDRRPGANGGEAGQVLLSDAETPPFAIESWSGEAGEETRLRQIIGKMP